MKIFTNKERQDIIRDTVLTGVNINEIINRAGEGVANEIAARWQPATKLVVFAGWGTKGAYALATARLLLQKGYNLDIYLFNIRGNSLCDECYNAKHHLLKAFPTAGLNEIVQQFDMPEIDSRSVVIDGLFGAEIDRPLARTFGMLIRSINESGAQIVSIEIPSGLFSEWNTNNTISRDIIHASLTLALEFPCLSYFMKENIDLIGEWRIIDIGLDREVIRKMPYTYYLTTRHDVHCILRPRHRTATKNDFGSALIIAGSYGMMGAAVLATRGCLRAGAGKVTCYGPKCGMPVLQTAAPAAMYISDSDETAITALAIESSYNAIGIGPGIGTSDATINAVEKILKMMNAKNCPLVIDADALNCIAHRPNMLNYLPQDSILTPHEREFDRIFGEQPNSETRLRKAIEVAQYHNIVIVLKGHYTAVIRPDGKVLINSSGTPALATGGSGDVLTGAITSFMAQGYAPEIAALLGVYVHGKAGRIAEETQGSYGVIADDIADNIGKAIKSIMQR